MKRIKDGQYLRMMLRTTPEQDKKVKKHAKEYGLSESQVIRDLIDNHLL